MPYDVVKYFRDSRRLTDINRDIKALHGHLRGFPLNRALRIDLEQERSKLERRMAKFEQRPS